MTFEVKNGFVVNPQKDYSPHYTISPFSNSFLKSNKSTYQQGESLDSYICKRFDDRKYSLAINGKSALRSALNSIGLFCNDIVTILTTSGNSYISSCVTNVVSEFCKWNMRVTSKSRAILVIHEFGFPFENLIDLKNYNLPIIEDCCYAFNSNDNSNYIYNVGDYLIFSFPKYFPVQAGGLLVADKNIDQCKANKDIYSYITKSVGLYIPMIEEIAHKRRQNWLFLESLFKSININPRFDLIENITNSVFIFRVPSNVNTDGLKLHMNSNGIESSVFYGEDTFFIPCHQYLDEEDLLFFFTVFSKGLSTNAK